MSYLSGIQCVWRSSFEKDEDSSAQLSVLLGAGLSLRRPCGFEYPVVSQKGSPGSWAIADAGIHSLDAVGGERGVVDDDNQHSGAVNPPLLSR